MLSPLPSKDDELGFGLPPHNIEAEEAVLGGLLIGGDIALERVHDLLSDPRSFYIRAHQLIYEAILWLKTKESAIDMLSVTTRLKDASRLEDAGGKIRIAQLVDCVISTANIDQYASLVADKYLRRRLGAAGRHIEAISYRTEQGLKDVLEASEQTIFEISQSLRTGAIAPIADLVSDTFSEIERHHGGMMPPGIATGFYDLDAMTQGFQRTDLIIAAGRPSMGKTSFITGIAAHVAQTLPVFFCSLEMSKSHIVHRFLSPACRIESSRLRAGRIANHEWKVLSSEIDRLSQLPIFLDDGSALEVSEIASKAREIKAKERDLGLIVVDYLQLMEGDGNDRVQALSRITRSFKRLALELNVPIVLLSQLSRGVESRTNKRPMMSDLRESGAIEQDADLIMMLYRDEYYNPDTSDRGVAEVILTKHRNGPTGTVKLLFQPEYTQFLNRAATLR